MVRYWACVTTVADEYVGRYLCYADDTIRQNGGSAQVNSRFELKLMKDRELTAA